VSVVARGLTVPLAPGRSLGPIDFEMRRGEMTAVTGPSGSGKTSLLAALGGLAPCSGSLSFDGDPVREGDPAHLGRSAMVLQGYGLVETLTATENVAVVLLGGRADRRTAWERARDALVALGLSDVLDQLASRLSGGQQQRVALARAIVTGPGLLLADEPTSELDADSRAVALELLREYAAAGSCVVVATHDPVIDELCDAHLDLRARR